MELDDFLLAQIAEDKVAAQAATPGPWRASEHYSEAGSIDTDAPAVDGAEEWPEWQARNIANESATGDIKLTDAVHIARHDPARVLAECEAKLEIVKAWQEQDRELRDIVGLELDVPPQEDARWFAYDRVLRFLAVPYADRPGYSPGWRP